MIDIVKILSTSISKGRQIAKLLRLGSKDSQTVYVVNPSGIDSRGIAGKKAVYAKSSNVNEPVLLGFINENSEVSEGEIKLYSVDSDGVQQNYILIKNDGNIEIGGDTDNMVRYSGIETAYNQLKTDHDDVVTKLNSIILVLKTWVVVPGDGGSALKLAAAALTNATPSTGDITPSKIDEVKTS